MLKIFYILFLLPVFFSCQSGKSVTIYPNKVGNIVFDKNIDSPDFKRCMDKDYGIQYYSVNDSNGLLYKGEKFAIIQELEKLNLSSSKKTNGYITIRFVVNCEGKTGFFRVQQMNDNYLEENWDKDFSVKLLNFTKSLNGWIAKESRGTKLDYYQYLTYKITDGKVSEILP
ncbi:hypothetical protein [Epilithonimonas zeae]|uniref:hypothetical protein n=1 Tax=Epilithonimonas zeae TaxID=1416779 RepID=UPI00200E07FD|nr:hypothetical protein [Epilithonimonas zeae]UQB67709.1 hypothetical protein KI430_11760 [Epilithonimonas zeae]